MGWLEQFNHLMAQGGPVMWVIFVTAVLAGLLLLERAIRVQLWLNQSSSERNALQQNPVHTPLQSGLLGRVLAALPKEARQDRDSFFTEVNSQLAEIRPRLEGRLATAATLATLLPMMGLLGTVTGMIEVFQVIALKGSGNPNEMAGGISQALFTTAAGLITAIPVIFVHHLLEQRLNHLMATLEQSLLFYARRFGGKSAGERET